MADMMPQIYLRIMNGADKDDFLSLEKELSFEENLFKNEEVADEFWKENFESQNLELLDEKIEAVAQEFHVEPRSLLSHVLKYYIKNFIDTAVYKKCKRGRCYLSGYSKRRKLMRGSKASCRKNRTGI